MNKEAINKIISELFVNADGEPSRSDVINIWNKAIDTAASAVEGSEYNSDLSGCEANDSALKAVESLEVKK